MEASVRKLFERYERSFNRSLKGDVDTSEIASLYTANVIAATPAGVTTRKNDDRLKQMMRQGFAHYRAIGAKDMRLRTVSLSPIDESHCIAHVGWTATYARAEQPDLSIEFDVHYFVRTFGGVAKVFGWVSGDEQALLKKHGIV